MTSQVLIPNTQKTEDKVKFWVVCCEETAATRQIAETVTEWQLPGVRSLVTTDLTEANAIAKSEYAIFITTCDQPSAQIKMSPLTLAQSSKAATEAAEHTPAAKLVTMHERYGQSPQSWWFKIPTTEVRAQKVQPVATEKSVAQGLAQVEIFVRNYTRELPVMARTDHASAASNHTASNHTASSHTTSNHTANGHTVNGHTVNDHTEPTKTSQPTKSQPPKRKVVLSHYRRL